MLPKTILRNSVTRFADHSAHGGVQLDEGALCHVCLEPIENYLCSACLFEQIYGWLKLRANYLVPVLLDVHKKLMDIFPTTDDNVEKCLMCTEETNNVFCSYCYTREIYYALANVDPSVSQEMILLFNFDFQNIGYDSQEKVLHVPVRYSDMELRFIEGYCEICRNYSEFLLNEECGIVCAECL